MGMKVINKIFIITFFLFLNISVSAVEQTISPFGILLGEKLDKKIKCKINNQKVFALEFYSNEKEEIAIRNECLQNLIPPNLNEKYQKYSTTFSEHENITDRVVAKIKAIGYYEKDINLINTYQENLINFLINKYNVERIFFNEHTEIFSNEHTLGGRIDCSIYPISKGVVSEALNKKIQEVCVFELWHRSQRIMNSNSIKTSRQKIAFYRGQLSYHNEYLKRAHTIDECNQINHVLYNYQKEKWNSNLCNVNAYLRNDSLSIIVESKKTDTTYEISIEYKFIPNKNKRNLWTEKEIKKLESKIREMEKVSEVDSDTL